MDVAFENVGNISDDVKDEPEFTEHNFKRYRLPRANKIQYKKICAKEQKNASLKKIALILQKCSSERTFDEEKVLNDCSEEVKEVRLRWRRRDEAKKRLEEFEDPEDILKAKCEILAQAIAQAQHLVVYTGAGISTSAKIPDYRGPNGIWTRLQQGKDIGNHDLTLAEPTYTHMALYELYKRNILKYVVSQNCDGLHLRSGLPKTVLSELHGNMYLEVCKNCKPHKEYWRPFDVTENTSRYFHKTSRKCYMCNGPLVDTIVHFGERGTLQWPLNWKGACKNAKNATTILCLGSSLKVLKKYPWLWQMDKPVKKRPNLYIVNLQWTPKDECANVKINGKCDEVMKKVMDCLGIAPAGYDCLRDPIYFHCSRLCELEMHTTTQPYLKNCFKYEKADTKSEIYKKSQVQNSSDKDCTYKVDLSDNSIPAVKSDFCDNICNRHKSIEDTQTTERLPEVAVSPFRSRFSIDSILNNSFIQASSNTLDYRVSQQNRLFNSAIFDPFVHYNKYFRDDLYKSMSDYYYYSYPYQSSWLYSGLHSIINPVPYIKEVNVEEKVEIRQPTCKFCYDNQKSFDCLFYQSTEPVFIKQEVRFSKVEQKEKANVCMCCDYSTDEDDLVDTKEDESKDQNDKSKVQAGWFGKGYKKARYRKK